MSDLPSRRDAVRVAVATSLSVAVGRSGPLRAQTRELLIRGGRVVNTDGVREADVRIAGDRIVEIGSGLRSTAATRVIDARGKLIVPGGVDPHTHIDGSFADDLESGSRAALAGGITSVGTFAFARSGETVLDAIARMTKQAGAQVIADLFLHGIAWPPTAEFNAALDGMAAAGHPSSKLFMPMPDFHAQLNGVITMLEAARQTGVVCMAHCEDPALLAAAVRRLTAAGQTSLAHYAESRPEVAEVAATELAVALCESTGAPVYVVHLSSARALAVCRAARRRGLPLYVETRPLYLHYTAEKLAGPDGPLFVGQPPLRAKEDSEALWAGLADGTIDVLATDHAPWTREQKLDPSLSISKLRPGMSDLQFMLPIYFSEGVRKRGLSLERFVATTSTNPARIFGLYPRKGVIREGSDADLAIWDPEARWTVRAADDHSRADYSVYEGWEVTGRPMTTIRRGEIVAESGRVGASPGSGRVVARSRWRRE